METLTVYRAINEAELKETAQLNGKTVSELLSTEGDLTFMLHQNTKWDHSPDNWPGAMLEAGHRRVIVELQDEIVGGKRTRNLETVSMWAIPGRFIWAVAVRSEQVRVKIARVVKTDGDTSANSG